MPKMKQRADLSVQKIIHVGFPGKSLSAHAKVSGKKKLRKQCKICKKKAAFDDALYLSDT